MTLLSAANTSLVEFVAGHGLPLPPLHVVDVGVSGGLNPAWRKWDNRLAAVGIDAIEDEIERLTKLEENPSVRYVASRAVAPRGAPLTTSLNSNYALHRSLAYLAAQILSRPNRETTERDFFRLWRDTVSGRMSPPPIEANYSNIDDPVSDPFYGYYARHFAGSGKPRVADRMATVDELLASTRLPRVDVLKVDTDGWDFDVLRGSEKALQTCLAVEIEVQFHGPVSDMSNVFCNIDSFLRRKGFSLFKLAPVTYARSALPKPFLYDIPAQNESGQVMWADALYVRTALPTGDIDGRRNLALVLDLYGLEDATAEILLETPGLFDGQQDRELLDFLARKVHGHGVTYRELVESFLADPVHFARPRPTPADLPTAEVKEPDRTPSAKRGWRRFLPW